MSTTAEIKSKINQVRHREEKRLINLARKTGLFDVRITSRQIEAMFINQLDNLEPKKQSQLSRLEMQMQKVQRKQTEQERKDNTRRKILLGSFIIAQMEHKPALKADLLPELSAFLELHKDVKVVANNKALLKDWLINSPAVNTKGAA